MSLHKTYTIDLVSTKDVVVDLMIDNLNYNEIAEAKRLGEMARYIQGFLNKIEKPSAELLETVLYQVIVVDEFGNLYNAVGLFDFDKEQTLAFLLTL